MPRRRRVRRLRGAAYPMGAALDLSRRLRLLLAGTLWDLIESGLVPALDEDERRDQLSAGVRLALARMVETFEQLANDAEIEREIRRTGREVDERHKREHARALRRAVGIDVFVASDVLANAQRERWAQRAGSLIKSVRTAAIAGLEADVVEAVALGIRHEELIRRWRERGLPLTFGTLEGRTSVIARDQAGKLNAALTEARQRELGVTHYVWRTAGDQRVRQRHRARNGKRFAWAMTPPDGHPGQAVQCRCTAEAVIDVDELLAQPHIVTDARLAA